MGEVNMACNIELYALSSKTAFTADRIQLILGATGGRGIVTILDRSAVLGRRHLAWGYRNAARAILDGKARARDHGLEVLRWVAGSHQVGEALERAGPDADTTEILIAIAPSDWPAPADRSEHPTFSRSATPIEIDDLEDETVALDIETFGSPDAPVKLGIPLIEGTDDHEVELSVLEWVATTELR